MPNGKLGDHPLTDLFVHKIEVYGKEADNLIRKIADLSSRKEVDEWWDKEISWNGDNKIARRKAKIKYEELLQRAKKAVGKQINNYRTKYLVPDEMRQNREELRKAIVLACMPTNGGYIQKGRNAILALDRKWVLENIEEISKICLNLKDYWEYRRLLELCELLDSSLTIRIALWGLNSDDPDIHEASEDFINNSTEQGA